MEQRENILSHVTPEFCIFLSMLMLFVPVSWILAWVISVGVHECMHMAMYYGIRRETPGWEVSTDGVRMYTRDLSCYQELLVALAGPIGSLFVIAFASYMPKAALCAALHLCYNLLPLYPLDGGRILLCLLRLVFPRANVWQIMMYILIVSSIISACFVLWVTVYFDLGIGFGMLAVFVFYRVWKNTLQTAQLEGTIVLPKLQR